MSGLAPTALRILGCAVDLFATRGYDATSVREICEAARITKPTLYHFFRSKDGVFRAIVGQTLDDIHEQIRTALRAHDTVEAQLRDVVRTAFGAAREHPRLWRFVFGTVWCPTRAPVEDMHRRFAAGPADIRLLTLMGTVSEALSGYLILGRPALTNELADAIVETLVHGWRPAAPPTLTAHRPVATTAPDGFLR